jgi:hypothetical protein
MEHYAQQSKAMAFIRHMKLLLCAAASLCIDFRCVLETDLRRLRYQEFAPLPDILQGTFLKLQSILAIGIS